MSLVLWQVQQESHSHAAALVDLARGADAAVEQMQDTQRLMDAMQSAPYSSTLPNSVQSCVISLFEWCLYMRYSSLQLCSIAVLQRMVDRSLIDVSEVARETRRHSDLFLS